MGSAAFGGGLDVDVKAPIQEFLNGQKRKGWLGPLKSLLHQGAQTFFEKMSPGVAHREITLILLGGGWGGLGWLLLNFNG